MKLAETAEDRRFRDEAREWLTAHVPREPRPADGAAMRDFDIAWQRTQFAGGWAGVAWPHEYGGRGLSLAHQFIWHEEYARAGAPQTGTLFVALSHAGPTLMVRGTDEQRSFHLPRILRGESVWCQGFSEPGAGSDLASLRTRAAPEGDMLVVTGTKIWTSYAQFARYQELLVRTGPSDSRHRGLTWLICDMELPGITVRPIRSMSGLTHFAEVVYERVRVPASCVVGAIGEGWSVAMTTLGFERGTATAAHQIELATKVDALIALARRLPGRQAARVIDEDGVATRLAELRAEAFALRALTALAASRGMRETVPGPHGNIVALYFGELTRRVHAAALDLLGGSALDPEASHRWSRDYLECFKFAIGGGTSEIRRNVIAERVLGLPRGR